MTMNTFHPGFRTGIFISILLALSFFAPLASEAVSRLDNISHDISEEYADEAILNEAEMAALERYARDMAKTRSYSIKSSTVVRDIALPGKETANGLSVPMLLALNESHKTTAATTEKKV